MVLNRNNILFFILVLIPLGFLATFRYPGLTPDTLSYYNLTTTIISGSTNVTEPFHQYVTSFLSIIPLPYYYLTNLTFFIYYVLFILALRQSYKTLPMQNSILFATLLQIFVYLNLVQMRWGLACAILMYSCQIKRTHTIKSILAIIFASCIHYFAILFIFLPFIKLKDRSSWIIIFLPIIFFFFSTPVIIVWIIDITKLISSYSPSDLSYVVLKLEYYINRIHLRDNFFNIFNAFNFITYMMIVILKIKNIHLDNLKNLIGPFLLLLSLHIFFIDIPIFSRRIMLLQTLFAVPIFFTCCLKFRPILFVYFVGMSLCAVSFVNIAFIKGLLRI